MNDCKNYEAYKRELSAWEAVTELAKTKQGNYIALTLPNKSKFGNDLRERVFESVSADDLKSEGGLKKVLDFLDKEIGKDAIDDVIEKWDDFDSCKKEATQSLEDFVADFELKSNRVKATGTTISDEILAYMLMKRAGLTNLERMLVMSRVDMKDKTRIYKDVKLNMNNILGKCLKSKNESQDAIKLEPAFLAQHEDVLAAAGYYQRNRAYTAPSKGGNEKYKQKGFKRPEFKQKSFRKPEQNKDKGGRPVNPKGSDGRLMTCKACGSFRHLVRDCPDSYEKRDGAYCVDDDGDEDETCYFTESDDDFEIERFVLFTSDKEEMSKFTSESINSAALDTCCTSTVAGEKWLKLYIKELPSYLKHKVQGPAVGKKCFQFGNQGVMKSKGRYKIPAIVADQEVMIEVDVIASDIPMLLSKAEMKKQGMILYMLEDKAEVRGKMMSLSTTSAGHYLLPLNNNAEEETCYNINEVCVVNLKTANTDEKESALEKLHKQFGHRPKQNFLELLKAAEVYSDDMSKIIDKIIDGCEGCIKRKRNPDRPVVAMPMASEFNEKVAIDLKIWNGKYILYMVDMWSRLTIAAVIPRKKPGDVVNMIMQKWVAHYGVMKAILNDNGGEFTGAEMHEVKSVLNVIDLTTGAESPWQNGLCEKNHALADNILYRMHEDFPNMDLETKLAWACMAKNSLQMVYGYSPNQLVFGKNPKLPNIASDGPPSWEEKTMSESLAKHLNALHVARRAFIKSESCSKLKLALKAKMRTNEDFYENGDIVYYKREKDDQWLGPAKVVFQDGKIIFIRHGAYFVRVSANRIVRAGEELKSKILASEGTTRDPDASILPQGTVKDLKNKESVTKHSEDQSEAFRDSQDLTKDLGLDPNIDPGQDLIKDLEAELNAEPVINSKKRKAVDIIDTARAKKQLAIDDKILLRRDDKIRFKEGENWVAATITGRGKCTGKWKNWFNVKRNDGKEEHSVDLDNVDYEMLNNAEDEHAMVVTIPKEEQNSPECLEAKQVELKKLKEFGTYKVVKDSGQDRISTTWVMSNKDSGVRARLVARGFEENDEIPKDSPTLAKSSLRTLLTISAAHKWPVETTDIKSAFLQGSLLERDVFIKPPKEANVSDGCIWKLITCLYGLRDASRQWYFKVRTGLLKQGFKQSESDPGLFFKQNGQGKLIGIVGIHVDDFIHAGSELFNATYLSPVLKVFQIGKNEKESFKYTGFQINQTSAGIMVDQSAYTKDSVNILPISPDRLKNKQADLTESERSDLRKMTGSLNWVVRATRPDLCFEMIDLSTKFKSGIVDDLIRVRKALKSVQLSKAEIFLSDLGDPSKWRVVCYTDAALGNLNDGIDSTGGSIVFVTNQTNKQCAVLDWQANKIKRVVRSTLAAEAMSLCDGLETAIHLRDLIEEVHGFQTGTIEIDALIDNQSTVDAVKSTTVVDDKRLRREIGSVKQMLERGTIKSVKWVPGSDQLADVLTKRGVNGCKLLQVIQKGKFLE